MNIKDNDTRAASTLDEQTEIAHTDGQISHSKRKLAKVGLAASGVMLTLASKSILAGGTGGVCTTPSGFSSINVSAPGRTPFYCSGKSPGYWMQHPEDWPNDYIPGNCAKVNGSCTSTCKTTGTPFHNIYGRTYPSGFHGFSGSKFGTLSLMGVMLDNTGIDPANVGMHVAAALLNLAKGGMIDPKVMTISSLLALWQEYATHGYYQPTANVTWYGADIVNYLGKNYLAP